MVKFLSQYYDKNRSFGKMFYLSEIFTKVEGESGGGGRGLLIYRDIL